MASFNSLPPIRDVRLATLPPMDKIATSVVLPPISTAILPRASKIGSPAPIAAATGLSSKCASRAPA